jgi:hypothetical protein
MRAIGGYGRHHPVLTVAIVIAAAWLALSLASLHRPAAHHSPLPAPPPALFGH